MNIISLSLYGNKPIYISNLLINALIVNQIYPGWVLRVYHDPSVNQNILEYLRELGVQLYLCEEDGDENYWISRCMFWRFRVMDDPEVENFLIRDADSILGDREYQCVIQWLASDFGIHAIHDHRSHLTCPILGGMWGGKTKYTRPYGFSEQYDQWYQKFDPNRKRTSMDQLFIKFIMLPQFIKDQAIISFGMKNCLDTDYQIETIPIPNHRPYHFNYLSFIGERNELCVNCNGKITKFVNGNANCKACSIELLSQQSHYLYFKNKVLQNKFILVKSVDGLGSNLETLARAKVVCNFTGRRLIVDWNDNIYSNNLTDNYFLDLFVDNDQSRLIDYDYLQKMSKYPLIWDRCGLAVSERIINISRNFKNEGNWIPKRERIELFTHEYRDLSLRDEELIIICNKIGHKLISDRLIKEQLCLLQPAPTITKALSLFDFSQIYTVGIHYRHGNGELVNLRNTNLFDKYAAVCDRLVARYPQTKILVCSDNSEIVEKFSNCYPGRVFCTTKWYPEKNTGYQMHGNASCPDNLENATTALTDIYLLSKCNHLIYTGSYFGKIAKYIGGFNEKTSSFINNILPK